MRRRPTATIASLALAACLAACATHPDRATPETSRNASSQPTPVPSDSPLAKVALGMNDTQVRNILGEPNNSNAYMTGKAFIPFYFGPDTHRADWMYEGVGRVVFSRNRWTGGLKVIRVLHDPGETAGS